MFGNSSKIDFEFNINFRVKLLAFVSNLKSVRINFDEI